MTIKDWIEGVSRSGLVCTDYMRKISAVETKGDMFRVLCDVNGGAWLFDLHTKGVPLPIEQFLKEYSAYINGGKTVEYPNGYTSKFYCKYADKDSEIEADTTLVYMLDCKARVYVPMNRYPTIILSDGCKGIDIHLDKGARANIETYGDATFSIFDMANGRMYDKSKVRITQH